MKLSGAIQLLEKLTNKKVQLVEYIKTADPSKTIQSLKQTLRPDSNNKENVWKDEDAISANDPGIKVAFSKQNLDRINIILKKAELLGYFPASFTVDNNPYVFFSKFDTNKLDKIIDILKDSIVDRSIVIIFEKNYDKPMEGIRFLYHATPIERYKKIKLLGLLPRSQNKISKHPDRIYFSIDLQSAERIAGMLVQKEEHIEHFTGEYVILKIDTNSISKNAKFYYDPNYPDGVYTYANIPPQCIKFVENY